MKNYKAKSSKLFYFLALTAIILPLSSNLVAEEKNLETKKTDTEVTAQINSRGRVTENKVFTNDNLEKLELDIASESQDTEISADRARRFRNRSDIQTQQPISKENCTKLEVRNNQCNDKSNT